MNPDPVGLYDPNIDKDSCGVCIFANLYRRPTGLRLFLVFGPFLEEINLNQTRIRHFTSIIFESCISGVFFWIPKAPKEAHASRSQVARLRRGGPDGLE
jgi:hypothetical protein